MKKYIILVLSAWMATSAQATQQCAIDGFSNSNMRLSSYRHSQAATSFNVRCDQGYSIVFNSENLTNASGTSYVSNGSYKLRTQLNLQGAGQNLWGVQLRQAPSERQKYVIAVQLQDNPYNGVPAGVYKDRVSVDIIF